MEIRLLNQNEIEGAVFTANEVFNCCARTYLKTQEEIDQYYQYTNTQHIWQEMSQGRLILWGALEHGQICGMSAMQSNGHITMLYVKPAYWHQRIGTQLMNHMRSFALSVLHLTRVTVHVMPVVSAPFFYKTGFSLIQGTNLDLHFVPLECVLGPMPYAYNQSMAVAAPKPEVTYPTKKVRTKVILAVTAITLLLTAAVAVGITIWHIAAEDMYTYDSFYEDELPEEFGESQNL